MTTTTLDGIDSTVAEACFRLLIPLEDGLSLAGEALLLRRRSLTPLNVTRGPTWRGSRKLDLLALQLGAPQTRQVYAMKHDRELINATRMV